MSKQKAGGWATVDVVGWRLRAIRFKGAEQSKASGMQREGLFVCAEGGGFVPRLSPLRITLPWAADVGERSLKFGKAIQNSNSAYLPADLKTGSTASPLNLTSHAIQLLLEITANDAPPLLAPRSNKAH